jgi:hypothetical protein
MHAATTATTTADAASRVAVYVLPGSEPDYTEEMIAELFMRAQSHKWWRDALEGDVDAAACVVKACVSGVLVCCDKQFYACVPNEYGSWMWSAITDDAVRLFIKFCFVRALHCDNNVDPAGEEDSMDRDFKVQDIRSEDEPKEAEVAEEASVDDAFTEQWCKRVAQQCKNTLRNDSFKSKLGSTARQWQPFHDGVRDVSAHDARVRPAQPDDYVDAKQTVDYVFGIGDADLAATRACDELEDAMLVACGDVKSTFDYLYAMLALYFTGIKTPQRLCFVLLGEGGNFKTSFVELLQVLLGALYVPLADETVTKRFAAAKPRPDLASLCGAYVAANDDLDGNLLSAPVRQLLGDGSIAIRRPYAPVQESIEPRCHLLVGGHCGMRIVSQVSDCQGLERRLRVLDMPVAFTPRDQYQPNGQCAVAASRDRMRALMKKARPALVRRLIAKAQQCAAQYAGSFFLPTDCRAVQEATETFLDANCADLFRTWLRTVTAVPPSDGSGDVELPRLFRLMPPEAMGEEREEKRDECEAEAMPVDESTASTSTAATTTASTSTAAITTASASTAAPTTASASTAAPTTAAKLTTEAMRVKIIAALKARKAAKAEAAAPVSAADAGGMDGPTGKFLYASFDRLRQKRRATGLDQHVPTRNRKSRVPRHGDGATYIDRQAFYKRMTAAGVRWSLSDDGRVRRAANYVWRDSLTPEQRAEQRLRFNAAIRRNDERLNREQSSLYGAKASTASESASTACESVSTASESASTACESVSTACESVSTACESVSTACECESDRIAD